MIKVQNISFQWPDDEIPVFRDLSLTISAGSVIALVGPNGCGKTTLGRILVGEIQPTTGLIDGTQKLKTAIRYQRFDGNLLPWYSAKKNLALADGLARSISVEKLISISGYEGWKRRRVSQLSGGQRQVLSVLTVFSLRPDLLVLDEPFSAIDPSRVRKIWPLVRTWARELSAFLVIISHNIEEAIALSDEVFIMRAELGKKCGLFRVNRNLVGDSDVKWDGLAGERDRLMRHLFQRADGHKAD